MEHRWHRAAACLSLPPTHLRVRAIAARGIEGEDRRGAIDDGAPLDGGCLRGIERHPRHPHR